MSDALFKAVRAGCTAMAWSHGVELMRADAVVFVQEDSDELEFRVTKTRQGSGSRGTVAVAVYLYPHDEDWSCDCPSTEDACAHVAAAVITLKQKGSAALLSVHRYRVGYELYAQGDALALRRIVSALGDAEASEGTTAETLPVKVIDSALSSFDTAGMTLVVSDADLQFERVLRGRYASGPIPQQTLPAILAALEHLPAVFFRGKPGGPSAKKRSADLADTTPRPIKILAARAGLQAVVEDCVDGFRVHLEQDAQVLATYANGALLLKTGLAAMISHGLGRRQYDELKAGQLWPRDRVGTLVGESLPTLRKTMAVCVRSTLLPSTKKHKPRIELHSAHSAQRLNESGDPRPGLKVTAHIVYGDPAVARVEVGADADGVLQPLGDGPLPIRDKGREKRLRTLVRDSHGLEVGVAEFLDTEEAIAFNRKITEAAAVQSVRDGTSTDTLLRWTSRAHHDFALTAALEPELHIEGDVTAALSFRVGARKVDVEKVMRAYTGGESCIMLEGGGLAPLPRAWLNTHGHRVLHLLNAKAATGISEPSSPSWRAYDTAVLAESLGVELPRALREVLLLREDTEGPAADELPKDLQVELRDYQRVGVSWLRSLIRFGCGALLADDMGLGKTLQTLCVIDGFTLVVAPTSVLYNWKREAERFRPHIEVVVYHGQSRQLPPAPERMLKGGSPAPLKPLLVLTTYALVRRDIDVLAERDWDLVVLDEAQAIKNATSQVTKAAFRLRAGARIALSGTPVENRLEDLWCQLNFLNRGLLGTLPTFQERYARPMVDGDKGVAKRLQERIRPFVLRRLKSQVAAELPPRTEVVRYCTLGKEERTIYNSVRAAAQSDLLERLTGDGGNALQILEVLLRLRQASCHAALVPGHDHLRAAVSSKVALLLGTLETIIAEGHKALIFSQWTSLLDLIQIPLDESHIEYIRIDGGTRDRQHVVDKFQSEGGPPVLLISLKAGGTGLNLTAADHVFLMDPWWNPAVEDQAADRAHRIGQTRPVLVHKLVARDTVEEAVLQLQDKKRALAEAALGNASTVYKLSREEILALLQ